MAAGKKSSAAQQLEIVARVVDEATPTLSRIKQRMKSINDEDMRSSQGKKKLNDITRLSNKLLKEQAAKADFLRKKFDMNTLSFLFAGMALKKLAFGTMKSLYTTYTKATDGQDAVSQGIQKVAAGFEFLKFSIFNALGQSPIFRNMVEFLVNATNKVSTFLAMNPKVSVLFLGLTALVGLLGASWMAKGIWMQTSHVIKNLGGLFGMKFLGTNLAGSAGLNGMASAIGAKTGKFAGKGIYYLLADITILAGQLFAIGGAVALLVLLDNLNKKFEAIHENAQKVIADMNTLGLTAPEDVRRTVGMVGKETMQNMYYTPGGGAPQSMADFSQGVIDSLPAANTAVGPTYGPSQSSEQQTSLKIAVTDNSIVIGEQTYFPEGTFTAMPP